MDLPTDWRRAEPALTVWQQDIIRSARDFFEDEQSYEFVTVNRISMNSPLWMDLTVGGFTGGSVVSTVVFLFKNPDKIGAWFPKLRASWYNGQAEAEKARQKVEKLRKARTEIRELEP
ncbi:hypothetical protein [Sphaerisporangium siamense]|uniref:Uncharacterized protein n=1 Tax=Sphaerisporangium siamense TaxID=795645 RepID=A0A7W7D9X1_9ACTN|nr:hypothetical protein [Sphaerisporangium siamense]MBB4702957.1 hypothetical protein [Sphaerisporangium siamense]